MLSIEQQGAVSGRVINVTVGERIFQLQKQDNNQQHEYKVYDSEMNEFGSIIARIKQNSYNVWFDDKLYKVTGLSCQKIKADDKKYRIKKRKNVYTVFEKNVELGYLQSLTRTKINYQGEITSDLDQNEFANIFIAHLLAEHLDNTFLTFGR